MHPKGLRFNQTIKANLVRLIDTDGTQIGVKPLPEALSLARSKGLDLIELVPQATPPVCKILDFSKFRYALDKKQRENRKKQKAGLLKEIRFKPRIGIHDLEVKIHHIQKFLKGHDKVRVTVIFRGRENQHKDLGLNLLKLVQEKLQSVASVEQPPTPELNRIMMTLVPKR